MAGILEDPVKLVSWGRVVCVGALLWKSLSASTIPASSFFNPTVIDFEDIGPNVPVSNQYSQFGVLFGPGLFGDPFPASTISGSREVTNFSQDVFITNPIVVTFTNPQTRVGFWAASTVDGGSIFVQAFLYSNLVVEAIFQMGGIQAGGNLPSVFVGLESPQGFDRLQISGLSSPVFSMDEFRFENGGRGTEGPAVPGFPILVPLPPWTPESPEAPPGGPSKPPRPPLPPEPNEPPPPPPTVDDLDKPNGPGRPGDPDLAIDEIPEPGSLVLIGGGLAALMWRRARRQSGN